MGSIDADAHVYECEETWAYLSAEETRFTPVVTTQSWGPDPRNIEHSPTEYWVVDNRYHPKNRNIMPDTSPEQRELRDVGARLAHMDQLGIDIQVIYPSLFLRPVMRTAASELALTRSYNRWMEAIWSEAPDRLHWVMIPSIQSMEKNRDEIARAKDHGACGIFMRGTEWERFHGDPYFFPLYELAAEFDLPCQLAVEEFMACGVGGCAGCTIRIQTPDGPAMKRVCVDGPVFDARAVYP